MKIVLVVSAALAALAGSAWAQAPAGGPPAPPPPRAKGPALTPSVQAA